MTSLEQEIRELREIEKNRKALFSLIGKPIPDGQTEVDSFNKIHGIIMEEDSQLNNKWFTMHRLPIFDDKGSEQKIKNEKEEWLKSLKEQNDLLANYRTELGLLGIIKPLPSGKTASDIEEQIRAIMAIEGCISRKAKRAMESMSKDKKDYKTICTKFGFSY